MTRVNIEGIEALVAFGVDLGARCFVLREIFYLPENDVVDHAQMPLLMLRPGEFARMREKVLARFDDRRRSNSRTIRRSTNADGG